MPPSPRKTRFRPPNPWAWARCTSARCATAPKKWRPSYSLPAQAAGLETYDTAMSAFYASQGKKVHGTWSNHSAKRVRDAAALSGRDRLVEALHRRGFELK